MHFSPFYHNKRVFFWKIKTFPYLYSWYIEYTFQSSSRMDIFCRWNSIRCLFRFALCVTEIYCHSFLSTFPAFDYLNIVSIRESLIDWLSNFNHFINGCVNIQKIRCRLNKIFPLLYFFHNNPTLFLFVSLFLHLSHTLNLQPLFDHNISDWTNAVKSK